MAKGALPKPFILSFACTLDYEKALELLTEVARYKLNEPAPFSLSLQQKSNLPAGQGGKDGRKEQWESNGAVLDVLIELPATENRAKPLFSMEYSLRFKDGLLLQMTGRNFAPILPSVELRMFNLQAGDFDPIHEIFLKCLGEGCDETYVARSATQNVESALDAGFGAFARYLIDRAMEASRHYTEIPPKQQIWWERLQELHESTQPGKPGSIPDL